MKPASPVILLLGIVLGLGGCDTGSPQTSDSPNRRQANATASRNVRRPAVAGLFYPRHKDDLAEAVDGYLKQAKREPVANLRGLVCPHAGYEFSGKTAAFGYKLLAGQDIRTVIVMAPTHYATFQGASIPDVEAYETPLGMIPLSPRAAELSKLKPFVVDPSCEVVRPPRQQWLRAPKELPPFGEDTPHTWEHSLEVQLPFLQRVLKDFSIVPIVFGHVLDQQRDAVDPEQAARVLVEHLDDQTILVASSDLSHVDHERYSRHGVSNPYETAKRLDRTCIQAICSLKTAALRRQAACGKLPILTLMHIARQKRWKAKLLDYRTTFDETKDMRRVVGYAAIAFYEPESTEVEEPPGQAGPHPFTPEERAFLLGLARQTVNRVVTNGTLPQAPADPLPKKFTEPSGCFVTLTKDGKLRGCIGSIFAREPLYQAVIHMARSAALRDHRFEPVTPEELDQIQIEVSVLTVPQVLEFNSPGELLDKLRPHRDGVVLRLGYRESTFLPQVWEDLPEKEEFLERLSRKAGLIPDAWRSPAATILIYQAEAFHESEK